MIGLVDCNSFYASCERVFRPDLANRPIVVLSNNDGCIVAMDRKAKRCGIKRGMPYFEAKADLHAVNAEVFSSNYTLYQDLSNRVMEILQQHAEHVETYSIDEAFIAVDRAPIPLRDLGQRIRKDLYLCTGIPVSIGFARTKTLAKIANRLAKSDSSSRGVSILLPSEEDAVLEKVNILDIWGIGRRKAAFLYKKGIVTAKQLRDLPDFWVKRHLTFTTLRTVWELRGIRSVEEELPGEPKQMILTSLGFSTLVTDLPTLQDAVSIYTATAVRKLLSQHSEAKGLMVFIKTNRFRTPYYSASRVVKLTESTSYLPLLNRIALAKLGEIYRPGYSYQKAGICLFDLDSPDQYQQLLFSSLRERERKLSESVREIQQRYGERAITSGRSGATGSWMMQRNSLSPRYTTCWEELPAVR